MTEISKLQKIVENLKHPRPYIRSKAIDDLMHIHDETDIPQLFKLVSGETDFVKVQFTRLLGQSGSDLAIHPLTIFLLGKSERLAEEAARSLDKIDSEKKDDALVMVLKRRISRYSVLFAVRSLGRSKAPKAVPYLVDLLSRKEEDTVRKSAIEALRQIGEVSAIRPLLKLLKDKDEHIVHLALLALGEIGETGTGDHIFPFLQHKNDDIRWVAVWALASLHYEKAVPQFIKMLETDPGALVRQEIAKRIGKLGKSAAVKPLVLAKAFDKDNNVKIYAGWCLRNMPFHEKEKVMAKMVGERDEVLRGAAVLEMGMTGNEKFFSLLSMALRNDRSQSVRANAAEGLSFIKNPEVEELLKKSLKDAESILMKKSVIHGLGKIGNSSTVSFLKEFRSENQEAILTPPIEEAIDRIERREKIKS